MLVIDILEQAIRIMGSKEGVEDWLRQPAIGLNQQRPIDLLTTIDGTKIVEEFLERIGYGVYT
jgi:putative toxin-antitoxin system antitoxin component (TIGR02293 family)